MAAVLATAASPSPCASDYNADDKVFLKLSKISSSFIVSKLVVSNRIVSVVLFTYLAEMTARRAMMTAFMTSIKILCKQ